MERYCLGSCWESCRFIKHSREKVYLKWIGSHTCHWTTINVEIVPLKDCMWPDLDKILRTLMKITLVFVGLLGLQCKRYTYVYIRLVLCIQTNDTLKKTGCISLILNTELIRRHTREMSTCMLCKSFVFVVWPVEFYCSLLLFDQVSFFSCRKSSSSERNYKWVSLVEKQYLSMHS